MIKWIPKDIKALRKRYKLSQKVLGGLLGITTNYVYLLEKGVKEPSKTLRLLLGFVEENLKTKGGEKE